jgi:hypothetical protein
MLIRKGGRLVLKGLKLFHATAQSNIESIAANN